ncbi:hypothetical protein C8N35_11644 [Breoghania corrubedonensis]|uniref:Uncharacterized protein n=1 Tax=Breoghania corrubedonensis TaxID=665038 RepID=A0A2T5UQ05_9HYPH|nr:hypothetical protein [Breoghania corrubedonensis]PTW53589.1 hypothetical protein C8N35_11644 [Breoghania corrubedonensis]
MARKADTTLGKSREKALNAFQKRNQMKATPKAKRTTQEKTKEAPRERPKPKDASRKPSKQRNDPATITVEPEIINMAENRPMPDGGVEMARILGRLGATDHEVGQAFGVTQRTIYLWKVRFPEFREALNSGKKLADDRVKESLYKRATGYSYDAEKVVVVDGSLVRLYVTEHVPPDTKAATVWLFNRDPDHWRAKPPTQDGPLGGREAMDAFLQNLGGTTIQPVEDPEQPENQALTAFSPVEEPEGES